MRQRRRGLDRVGPMCRTPGRSRLGDSRRGSRGLCGTRAYLGEYGKTRRETVVGCKQSPPAAGTAIDSGDRCRNTSELREGAARSPILIRGPCGRNSQNSAEVKGSPPKTAFSVRGTSPPKPTPRIDEEGAFSPQALMMYIRPSSTGFVDPLRRCFVAGSGKRNRKSALPFTHPLLY